ncbi:MAG TPA: DUF4394 domain-containing protein [Patescibacteria group bacterium]|nr:DUF4394 domain-containing protein [Patescibacteria group bacterium]
MIYIIIFCPVADVFYNGGFMTFSTFKKLTSAALLCGVGIFGSSCNDNEDPITPGPVSTGRSIFGVDGNNNLIRFGATSPDNVTITKQITGLQGGDKILGIDFRPKDGKLYGIGSGSRIYTIDTATGVATQIGSAPFTPAINGADMGWDFNPVPDRIRLHTNEDQNLRLHPDTGLMGAIDSVLKYDNGDVNFGLNPTIVATTYTNSDNDTTTGTTLYAIDANLDILVTLASPNNGRLRTVGTLGVLTSNAAGFDIPANTGIAYAALSTGTSGNSLYTIELTTGKATLVGAIKGNSPLIGIAVAP